MTRENAALVRLRGGDKYCVLHTHSGCWAEPADKAAALEVAITATVTPSMLQVDASSIVWSLVSSGKKGR